MPSIQFVHVGVSAIRPGGVTSLNLCIVVVCRRERRGGGEMFTALSLLYVVIGIVFVGFCASWLNDSCAVPLTFSSLLFVSSLSSFRVFVPFLEQISMPVCSSLA